MKIDYYAKSDIGLVRKANEDSYGASEMLNLFMVADGMGGYEHGKEASRTVINAVRSFVEEKCFSSSSINENIIYIQLCFLKNFCDFIMKHLKMP